MKQPNGEPIGANGYIAAGYYGDPQHQQQQQHHQQQQYHQQQSYIPQQQMEDYTHYPHPEEYMSERNRAAYFANGDQYAMPSKPRQRLESDCKFFYKRPTLLVLHPHKSQTSLQITLDHKGCLFKH